MRSSTPSPRPIFSTGRVPRSLAAIAVTVLLAACTEGPTEPTRAAVLAAAPEAQAGPSVNGGVGYVIGGELQNTTFHARVLADGRIVGALQNKSRGQDHAYHGVVDCLVVDGNTARLGGVITSVRNEDTTTFPIIEGSRFWLGVVDNGEGEDAPADQFTDVFVNLGPSFQCQAFGVGVADVAHGQVQVRP